MPDTRNCKNCKNFENGLCGEIYSQDPRTFQFAVKTVSADKFHTFGPLQIDGVRFILVSAGSVRFDMVNSRGDTLLLSLARRYDGVHTNVDSDWAITATALEPARICLFRSDLRPHASQREHTHNVPIERLNQREIEKMRLRLSILQIRNAVDRLAAFLWVEAGRPAFANKARTLYLPFSREDIAQYLLLSSGTISRSFSALEQRDMIEIDVPTRLRCLQNDGWKIVSQYIGQ